MELLVLAALLGIVPAMVARSKGRDFLPWWIYGSFLFLVALPHALLLKPEIKQLERQQAAQGLKKCPFCAEMIKPDARVCRYCGRDLPEGDAAQPGPPVAEEVPRDRPVEPPPAPTPESPPRAKVWAPPPWERSRAAREEDPSSSQPSPFRQPPQSRASGPATGAKGTDNTLVKRMIIGTLVVVVLAAIGGQMLKSRYPLPQAQAPTLPSYESVYRRCEDSLVSVDVKPRAYLAAKPAIFGCVDRTPHQPPSAVEEQRMRDWWAGVELAAQRGRD